MLFKVQNTGHNKLLNQKRNKKGKTWEPSLASLLIHGFFFIIIPDYRHNLLSLRTRSLFIQLSFCF